MAKKCTWDTIYMIGIFSFLIILLIAGIVVVLVLKDVKMDDGGKGTGGSTGNNNGGEKETMEKSPCPDKAPGLRNWNPGMAADENVVIDGQSWLLVGNATLNTITIKNGGKLIIQDAGHPIHLRTKNINIREESEFHIGGEKCPYMSKLTITLLGTYTETTTTPEHDIDFGYKFIGVYHRGGIAIHGPWKMSWTFLENTLPAGDQNTIISLADDASSWLAGDRIVIASSTRDMYQAEEFDVIECDECQANQIKIKGERKYQHLGEWVRGVDMRAEVGLLTRSIKIHGEMEDSCSGPKEACTFFDFDVFGGQVQVLDKFTFARFENFELYDMGQQSLGNYPIHFHRSQKSSAGLVRGLSIHHCFNRCVTIHSTMDLLVEDVVGYDTLGHCFFTEDGNEVNNTLRHNLGLLTKAGILLPPDRNSRMCRELRDGVYVDYMPDPEKDCMGVSTFWIQHPDNTFEDNSAAGSEEIGWAFVFPKYPTGLSLKSLPDYHAQRTPLGKFINNRAHANKDHGLLLDRGLKTDDTVVDKSHPREVLSFVDNPRLQAMNLSQNWAPASIHGFVAYDNHQGVFARGRDVFISNGQFADNDVGVTLVSSDTLPYYPGAHQEVTGSRFIGRTGKQERLGEQLSAYPYRGVEFSNGPMLVKDCSFSGFTAVNSSALGFRPKAAGHNSPWNQVERAIFGLMDNKVWFGAPGGVFGDLDLDGDLTAMFSNPDGSVTGTLNSYVVNAKNKLMSDNSCETKSKWGGMVCSNTTYSMLIVDAKTPNLTSPRLTIKDEKSNATAIFRGSNKAGNPLDVPASEADWTSVLAVVQGGKTYRLSWSRPTPLYMALSIHALPRGSFVSVVIPYPNGTRVSKVEYVLQRGRGQDGAGEALTAAGTRDEIDNDITGLKYFYDPTNSELFFKLVPRYPQNGYDYCSKAGCERVIVTVES